MHTFPSVYQLNKSGTASCYDKPFNAPDKVAQPRQTNPVVEAVHARTSVSGSSPKRPASPSTNSGVNTRNPHAAAREIPNAMLRMISIYRPAVYARHLQESTLNRPFSPLQERMELTGCFMSGTRSRIVKQCNIRHKIYDVIEVRDTASLASRVYNRMILLMLVVSLLPLAFKGDYAFFSVTDIAVVTLFSIDYLLNWITADIRFGKRSVWSFIRYPFSASAIVNLLSILPILSIMHDSFRLLRLARSFRLLRMVSLFKMIHHSRNMVLVIQTVRESKESLLAVGYLALGYITLSALVVFNVEPTTFHTFFDALYWATVSLTTVGYGDIYPVSFAGRCVTMLSSLLGIALVALPAGIITAGYMNALQSLREKNKPCK